VITEEIRKILNHILSGVLLLHMLLYKCATQQKFNG